MKKAFTFLAHFLVTSPLAFGSPTTGNDNQGLKDSVAKKCQITFIRDEMALGGVGESASDYRIIYDLTEDLRTKGGWYDKKTNTHSKFQKPPVPPTPNPPWGEAWGWVDTFYDSTFYTTPEKELWGNITTSYRHPSPQGLGSMGGADTIIRWKGDTIKYYRLPEKAPVRNKQIGKIKAFGGNIDLFFAVGYERGEFYSSEKSTAKIWRFNEDKWSEELIPDFEGKLKSVAVLNTNDAWAAGDKLGKPILLHFDGKSWTEFSTPLLQKIQDPNFVFDEKNLTSPKYTLDLLVPDNIGGILFFGSEYIDNIRVDRRLIISGYRAFGYRWDGQNLKEISTPVSSNITDRNLNWDIDPEHPEGPTSKIWSINAANNIGNGKLLVYLHRKIFGEYTSYQNPGIIYIYDVANDKWTFETAHTNTSSQFDTKSMLSLTPGVASMVGTAPMESPTGAHIKGLYIYDCR